MNRVTNRRGFTLVEILVALVLLTIGALGFAAMSATVAHANRDSTNRTRADQLLHEKIEELQSTSYATIDGGNDAVEVGGVDFQRLWTVEENVPIANVKRIVLQATWVEKGRTLRMWTATLITKVD